MSHVERVAAARAAAGAEAVIECRSLYPYCACARELAREDEQTLFYASSLDIYSKAQLVGHEIQLLDQVLACPPKAGTRHVIVVRFERWASRVPGESVEQCLSQLRALGARLTFVERHRTVFLTKPHPTGGVRACVS